MFQSLIYFVFNSDTIVMVSLYLIIKNIGNLIRVIRLIDFKHYYNSIWNNFLINCLTKHYVQVKNFYAHYCTHVPLWEILIQAVILCLRCLNTYFLYAPI